MTMPDNEPVLDYAPGSAERLRIEVALDAMAREAPSIPLYIGADRRHTAKTSDVVMPHRHQTTIATVATATPADVHDAIEAAQRAKPAWAAMPYEARARIFLRAADLIAGPRRDRMNAATMLGQSKTVHEAEIDAVCEQVDFLRFNTSFGAMLERLQPCSPRGALNVLDFRPLDGFVLAITPFNFTAIAGNLPTAPALMGNTVVWKPTHTQLRAAYETMEALLAAGLPPGVLNLVAGDSEMIGDITLGSEHLGGLHFTGSVGTFQTLYRKLVDNLERYHCFPRVVGETGGKDFIVAHPSAQTDALITAILRGGYEYQGQKCSAASRCFIAQSVWDQIEEPLCSQIRAMPMGDPMDFDSFLGAVIDRRAYDKITGYVELARSSNGVKILVGGEADRSVGYFIRPTLVRVESPTHRLMSEEIFGPVLSVYVYADARFREVLDVCDQATDYGLTGAVFADDRRAIDEATETLRFAAGNLTINDKPTGSIVNQQPFGGSRRSGTNDKAGSILNLTRWVSPRTIKETFVPPTDYRYPYMGG